MGPRALVRGRVWVRVGLGAWVKNRVRWVRVRVRWDHEPWLGGGLG